MFAASMFQEFARLEKCQGEFLKRQFGKEINFKTKRTTMKLTTLEDSYHPHLCGDRSKITIQKKALGKFQGGRRRTSLASSMRAKS
jgi:hypothetical protein